MSYRVLVPLAEARRYSPFAFHGPWRSWSTEDRMWAGAATGTQGVIAYYRRKNGTLPPTWVYVSRMRRVLASSRVGGR